MRLPLTFEPVGVASEPLKAAKKRCTEMDCGGFVFWHGQAFLRSRPSVELAASASNAGGSTLFLPASSLAAARSGVPDAFRLAPELPEVVVDGARPVDKRAKLSEAEMTERFVRGLPTVLTDAQAV